MKYLSFISVVFLSVTGSAFASYCDSNACVSKSQCGQFYPATQSSATTAIELVKSNRRDTRNLNELTLSVNDREVDSLEGVMQNPVGSTNQFTKGAFPAQSDLYTYEHYTTFTDDLPEHTDPLIFGLVAWAAKLEEKNPADYSTDVIIVRSRGSVKAFLCTPPTGYSVKK